MDRRRRRALLRGMRALTAFAFAMLPLFWASTGARIGFPAVDLTVSAWWVALPLAGLLGVMGLRLTDPRFGENRRQALRLGYGPMSDLFRGRP